MKYGSVMGIKFFVDGSVRQYPGNTVVADVTPGCSAYDVMTHLRQMVIDAGFADRLILLPEDSYHMTVISGLNHQVRTDERWPEKLPKDLPMEKVDDYISEAVERAGIPGPARMKFDAVHLNSTCLMVRLWPVDEAQHEELWKFRNQVAENVGLRLPGHEKFRFHITLAYTRVISEGEEAERLKELLEAMNRYLAEQPAFTTGVPYMAYYDDMLAFSPERLPRD